MLPAIVLLCRLCGCQCIPLASIRSGCTWSVAPQIILQRTTARQPAETNFLPPIQRLLAGSCPTPELMDSEPGGSRGPVDPQVEEGLQGLSPRSSVADEEEPEPDAQQASDPGAPAHATHASHASLQNLVRSFPSQQEAGSVEVQGDRPQEATMAALTSGPQLWSHAMAAGGCRALRRGHWLADAAAVLSQLCSWGNMLAQGRCCTDCGTNI